MASIGRTNLCKHCNRRFPTLAKLTDHEPTHRSDEISRVKQFERLKLQNQEEAKERANQKRAKKKQPKTRKLDSNDDDVSTLDLLDTVYPASKILGIINAQNSEACDRTTTVVLLFGELLKIAKAFIEKGVLPDSIIRSFQTAASLVNERVSDLAMSFEGKSMDEKKLLFAKCASTALSSKLIGGEKEFFSTMVVDAVSSMGIEDKLNYVDIKKVPGGTVHDSFFANGVAFRYAGFEQQSEKLLNPKILLLSLDLELKSEKEAAEIRFTDSLQHQSIVLAEKNIMFAKLEKCAQSGVQIVLSHYGIGELATQYLADRCIFSAGNVSEEDLHRVSAATGAMLQTSVNNLIDEIFGTCEIVENKQVGNESLCIFSGCLSGVTATIVLRGGAAQFTEEAERMLKTAVMMVRTVMKDSSVVAGCGAIDMEISRYLSQHAKKITGKSQQIISSYAKALEVIPRQLCDDAGLDGDYVLNRLRQTHAISSGEGSSYGVDIDTGEVVDSHANSLWEPAVGKINAIRAATDAACLVLSGKEIIHKLKS